MRNMHAWIMHAGNPKYKCSYKPLFWVFRKTRTVIVVRVMLRGSTSIPGTRRQSRKGFNIYFPLLFINILAKESILLLFFLRTVTAYAYTQHTHTHTRTHLLLFKKKVPRLWKGWGYKKPVFLEKEKKHATVTHPVKGLHKIYAARMLPWCVCVWGGGRTAKKNARMTHTTPRSMLI